MAFAEFGLTEEDKQQLPLQVLKKFRLIFGSVRQHFRQVEHSCGVSGSQLWLLQEVVHTPGVGVSELAERLSIHQSTCSQLVEKLVARGYVRKERSQADLRRVGLVPGPAAETTLAQVPGPVEGILPEALLALPDATLNRLDASLSEVIGQLRMRDDKFADKPLADL